MQPRARRLTCGAMRARRRHDLSNPVLPTRSALGAELNAYDRDSFYNPMMPVQGYTDCALRPSRVCMCARFLIALFADASWPAARRPVHGPEGHAGRSRRGPVCEGQELSAHAFERSRRAPLRACSSNELTAVFCSQKSVLPLAALDAYTCITSSSAAGCAPPLPCATPRIRRTPHAPGSVPPQLRWRGC